MTTLAQGNAKLKIRNAYARAFWLRCRKADGCQIALTHQGAAATIHWAWTDADQTSPNPNGNLIIEPEVRTFRIPLQVADPASGSAAFGDLTTLTLSTLVSENDEIEWAGGIYVVGPQGWNMDHFEAVWNVTAVRRTVRRATP